MMGSSDALVALSTSVMRTALNAWFSRRDTGHPVGQLLADEVPDPFDRRRLTRQFDSMRDAVSERLMRDTDARSLPENERHAAVLAASESFDMAALTKDDLLSAAMSPTVVADIVRARSTSVADRAALSEAGLRLYHALIGETAAVLVTTVGALPQWESHAAAALLRRQDDIGVTLAAILERLPSGVPVGTESDAEDVYRQLVVTSLDRTESVGFSVAAAANALRLGDTFIRPDVRIGRTRQPLEWALADHNKLFLHGPAGSGKTSVLRWLAISSATGKAEGLIRFLNDMLSVYVPLHTPDPQHEPVPDAEYLARIAYPQIEPDRIRALLQERCEAGKALLLFDGLDEIAPKARRRWLHWLGQMTDRYPDCRFVVASRASSFEGESLVDRHFTKALIEPFDDRSKALLIRQWFAATKPGSLDRPNEAAEPAARLTDLVRSSNRLHDLAATPLMCTLMCALFRERGEVPLRGIDVYDEFVDMLVVRRDTERGISGVRDLPKPEALTLLEELARFMVLHSVVELSRGEARSIVTRTVPNLPRLGMDPEAALDHLLTRSGLLIEPAYGRIQFVHVTLMEYLAARSLVENEEIESLAERAHNPAWHSVIVLAAAQARPSQGEKLIRGLLRHYKSDDRRGVAVAAVLQESVAGMIRLSPDLRNECERVWRRAAAASSANFVITLADGGHALDELHAWLTENDELRRLGPVVVSRDRNRPEDTLIVTGSRSPDSTEILRCVLEWYKLSLQGHRPQARIEADGLLIDLGPSS